MFLTPLADQRNAHVESLARAHHIRLCPTSRRYAQALVRSRLAAIPRPIRSSKDYIVGLHELAHCVLYDGVNGFWAAAMYTGDGQLIDETRAWRWAFQHALPELMTPAAERYAKRLFWTYIPGSEKRSLAYDTRRVWGVINTITILLGFSLAIALGL